MSVKYPRTIKEAAAQIRKEMEMEKFKAGEKVAVYWTNKCNFPIRELAHIIKVQPDGAVDLEFIKTGKIDCAHYKQLRRLKPRKRRSVIWVSKDIEDLISRLNDVFVDELVSESKFPGAVRFVESPERGSNV